MSPNIEHLEKPNIKLKTNLRTRHNCQYESCGKSFSHANGLRKHMHQVHVQDHCHKCESCGKSFLTAQALKKHITTIHDGHKDYKCKFCAKSFSQAGSLGVHIRNIHENLKEQSKRP